MLAFAVNLIFLWIKRCNIELLRFLLPICYNDNMKKILLAGFLTVLAGFFVFWFFIIKTTQPFSSGLAENSVSQSKKLKNPTGYAEKEETERPAPSAGLSWALPVPEEPEIKPFFEEEKDKLAETFLERFSALSNSSSSDADFNAISGFSGFQSAPINSAENNKEAATIVPLATSSEIILSLTDKEFHSLYPDTFIKSLIEAQELFIKVTDPDYKPLLEIKTDAQVRFIEEKLVDSFLLAEMITKEDAEKYINTIRVTLPQLQIKELESAKSSVLIQSSILLPSVVSFAQQPLKGLFLAELMDKLLWILLPEAQAKACGACFSWPDCFQVGSPLPYGFNLWMPFCYCTGCYWAQGCLSYCTSMSAIWDPASGICGCG